MKRITKTKTYRKAQSKVNSFAVFLLLVLLSKPSPERSLEDWVNEYVKHKAEFELAIQQEPVAESIYPEIKERFAPERKEAIAKKLKPPPVSIIETEDIGKPVITINDIKKIPGYENISDEEAQQAIEGLQLFSLIAFDHLTNSNI